MDLSAFGSKVSGIKNERVLVVDDDPTILRAFSRTVKQAGWRVDTADSASSALKLAKKNSYHVVVADHQMPEMTGEQLIVLLRQQQPNARYIVMTGHCDFAVAACRTPGLFVVISKPWDDDTLRTILSACTRSEASGQQLSSRG